MALAVAIANVQFGLSQAILPDVIPAAAISTAAGQDLVDSFLFYRGGFQTRERPNNRSGCSHPDEHQGGLCKRIANWAERAEPAFGLRYRLLWKDRNRDGT
jgi:hypothetical protein